MTAQEEDAHPHQSNTTALLLAEELNEMSVNEREQILFDVHGVVDVTENDKPETIQKSLLELERAITRIIKKPAYNLAMEQSSEYVNDKQLRLQFLRSENFHVAKTAQRLVRFFESKLELFGPERLVRDIHMNDLDHDDLICLQSGIMQIVPLRDASGRAIVASVLMVEGNASVRSRVSFFFHLKITNSPDGDEKFIHISGKKIQSVHVLSFFPLKNKTETYSLLSFHGISRR